MMERGFETIANFRNANGWVVDTSVAVCLQTAGWTAGFLALAYSHPCARQIRIAPTAFLNEDGEQPADEFSEQLTSNHLALWESAANYDPNIISAPFGNQSRQEVQAIIRASRRGGRAISRADAEGVYLARRHNCVLLTGDHRQAQMANTHGVTVVHKFTVLASMARYAGLPVLQLCQGLTQLIANSGNNAPCALSDRHRDGLREIRRQKCPANHAAA